MKTKMIQAGLIALLLLVLVGTLAVALGGINGRFTITSGGGQGQASGVHLTSAFGQPVGGTVSSGSEEVVLCSGLICGATIPPAPPINTKHVIHLPIVRK